MNSVKYEQHILLPIFCITPDKLDQTEICNEEKLSSHHWNHSIWNHLQRFQKRQSDEILLLLSFAVAKSGFTFHFE